MRGKVQSICEDLERVGITPAYAGKRTLLAKIQLLARDHPRMCGEKDFVIEEIDEDKGSPPHVRGKADPHKHRTRQAGITPACAGKR